VRPVFVAAVILLLGLSADRAGSAAPEVDLHELAWHVHVDLIDVGAGRDLAYWRGVIDEALASANGLIEGGQGPFDNPCCARLARSGAVTTFGSPGDGLDLIDSRTEQTALNNFGWGSHAFLVDGINYCGGSAPGSIGCAELPSCDGNADDDPNVWMAVTVDAFDDGTLAAVVAHERGHNACLPHVGVAECQVMQASVFTPGIAGCLAASECSNYEAGRTESSSGLACGCHDEVAGLEPDGVFCPEVSAGVCSGGLCGNAFGDAGVGLIAAADPGSAGGSGPPDDALAISALKGDWKELGRFSTAGDEVEGLAYARDSGVLYGVVPGSGNDVIVKLDPATGAIDQVAGAIPNGSARMISMAYDPGATSAPSDDRLIVLEVSGSSGELRWVDPASPGQSQLYGSLGYGSAQLFSGLAYDSDRQLLYAATPFEPDGLYWFDLSTCPPSPCDSGQVSGAGVFRDDASLAWSPQSGMLYQVGTAFDGERTFYNVIDPTTGLSAETVSIDLFTPSALAAVPEPSLATALALGSAAFALAARAHRRHSSSRSL
jgi:hypothetical protein